MKKQKMKRGFALLMGISLALTIFLSPILHGMAEEPEYLVIVDPGHGGTDGGAVGDDGTVEKNLNLSIALLLKETLEEQGIRVIMTRETDEDTDGLTGFHKRQDLEQRAKLGNESGADAYISIHINASTARKDQGFQVWFGKGNTNSDQLAQSITKAVQESKICNRTRSVKQVPETLYIFRTVTVPSVLVECGFISNATDLHKLQQETFRKELCIALSKGILNYLSGSNSRIT